MAILLTLSVEAVTVMTLDATGLEVTGIFGTTGILDGSGILRIPSYLSASRGTGMFGKGSGSLAPRRENMGFPGAAVGLGGSVPRRANTVCLETVAERKRRLLVTRSSSGFVLEGTPVI